MLKIIIIPAALMGLLAVYAMVEESVERRLGRRRSPQFLDKNRQYHVAFLDELKSRQEAERKIIAAIDAKFNSRINRARLWIASRIAP